MNINNLKVGDRVKFNWNHNNYLSYIGLIKECKLNWVYVETLDSVLCDWVYKDNIISKLEPLEIQYKEIPIEKEPNYPSQYLCPKCHCSHGVQLNKYSSWPVESKYCDKCQEDFTTKSYKFDIKITEFSQEIKRYGEKSANRISGYSLNDGNCIRFENLPAPEWIDFNREYTIEIKEKQN